MSTDTLTFGPMTDLPEYTSRAWQVSGDRGAVTFQFGLCGPDILFHSRRPFHAGQEASDSCVFVDHDCYGDTGILASARKLRDRWEQYDRDDEVIRIELERLYLSELPEPSAVR